MCGGSRAAKKAVDAAQNTTFQIGKIDTHGAPPVAVGALHAPGETVATCVHCIQTGQRLTLSNIPIPMQRQYGLGATAVCTFTQSTWNKDDLLSFDKGPTIGFAEFADKGVLAFTDEKVHDTKQTVAGIIADATEVAAHAHEQRQEAEAADGRLVDA